MHWNLRPYEPRQPFPSLITTLGQVWSRWTYPLPYYSVFAADTLLYAVILIKLRWNYLRLRTFAVYRLWRDETLYQIWTQSSNLRRSYCDFGVWPYDLEHCITRCARLCDNFHHVWHSTTYPCMNYNVFDAGRYITLWPWPLTHWPWKFVVYQALRGQIMYEIWEKSRNAHNFANFRTRYVIMWPWPLTSWPWTFTTLWVSCV